jgi:hypothetical protein
MYEFDAQVLTVLSRLEDKQSARSPWVNKQLEIDRNRENNWKVRASLGRLKRQKLVKDHKTHEWSEYKYWEITELGRQKLVYLHNQNNSLEASGSKESKS